jgi:peptidoglycan hydrolase-like protein with peptidoglycan-binding domain
LFSNKPHLKHKLHSIGQQALSVTTRLTDIRRAGPRRETELFAQLGDLNCKLVEMEAAHLALQAKLQRRRDESARNQEQDRERIADLQQQVATLGSQRDSAWQRVRELEMSLGEAHGRQADIETRFETLRNGLERDRSALQAELDRAQAALARSRQEVQQLRAHGSRVLEAMQQAQRLADESGATARELDRYLERSSRLLHPREVSVGAPARPDGAAASERLSASRRLVSRLLAEGWWASRQLRVTAGLPLLIGALVSTNVMWFGRDDTQPLDGLDQQAQHAAVLQGESALPEPGSDPETLAEALATRVAGAAGQGAVVAETGAGAISVPVVKQARAALATLEIASPVVRGQVEFDPEVQRQQRDLLALGFDLGHSRADGRMGSRTRQALIEFEALYGPATGLESLSGEGQLVSLVETLARRAREDAVRLDISSEVLAAIQLGHMRTGVAFSYLAELAAVESRFDPTTRSASSTATGLYQFTEDTWLQMVRAHGEKYALSDYVTQIEYVPNGAGGGRLAVRDPEWHQPLLDLRYSARISALMAAEFARDNERKLASALDREIEPTDLYFAHFLGVADAIAFLSLLQVMPDQIAGKLFPEAATANGAIFHPPGEKARTVAEVYALFDRKFNTGRYEGWDLELMLAEAGQ